MLGTDARPRRKRTFTRRRFLATAGAAVGMAGMVASTGCQSIQTALSGKPSAGGAATVRYMGHFTALGDTARDRAQKKIEETFKASHPNLTIQWEATAWQTIGEKYMAAWSANTAPDISHFSPANITPVIRLGALEDLQPALSQWPDQDKNDFSKAWWDTGTYEGKKYIAPLLLFGTMMVYRKSLFEKAGVNISEIKSWQQFVDACQKVTVDGQGRNPTQAGFDPTSVQTWGFGQATARGGTGSIPNWQYLHYDRLNRPPLGPPDWKADHWTSPEIVESSQFMTDWITKTMILPKDTLTWNNDESGNAFNSGRVAVYAWGTHLFGPAREKFQFPPDDVVWGRHPSWEGKRFSPILVDHWSQGISSRSKVKDQAMTVITGWMSPEADLILSDVAAQQPKRSSSTKDKIFERPELSFVKLFDEATREWAVPLLSPPVRESELLIQAVHSIVNDNVPVEKALGDARDAYNKLLADIPADQIPKY
jgi:ABC-type glycerol-3-phosphate transport system substrate-binding protein